MARKPVVTYRTNRREMDQFLRGRNGPVTLIVANAGRQLAGESGRQAPSGPPRTRGGKKLKQTIQSRIVPSAGAWAAEVYSTARHAGWVVRGRRSFAGKPWLVFKATVGEWAGQTIFIKAPRKVRAQKPNNFFRRAAERLGLKVRAR